MTAGGDEPVGRLVRADPAEMRGNAQRAADVGAERQRAETSGERRRRSARGAARRPCPVPRIVGRAVNVVVALPVAEAEGHIGLAEDDGAGVLEARDRERVFLGDEILERRVCPRSSAIRRCCRIP